MHIKRMHEMMECLSEYGKCMVESGVGGGEVNICELGQVVDMLKDLSEAEYHAHISKAMEKEEEEGRGRDRMYFPMGPDDIYPMIPYDRMKSGSESWRRDGSDRWDKEKRKARWEDADADRTRVQPRRGTGRYGFSFDEYMETRETYPGQEPEHKRIRMEALNRELDELVDMGKEVVQDMSPEEKQAWKGKISKILNM